MASFPLAQSSGNSSLTVDQAVANVAAILDEIAADTPWLTEISFAGNELWQWLALVMTLAMAATIGRGVRFTLMRAAGQAEIRLQKVLAVVLTSLANSATFAAFALGLPVGIRFLTLLPLVQKLCDQGCGIVMATAVGCAAYGMVDVVEYWLRSFSSRTASRLDDMLAPLVTRIIRATIVTLLLVQVVQIVTGMAPASIIAGLGVGGLAVGLAAQDTIKNIFGSLMIFSDRPFELGDTITVDGRTGTVENVGFRSTRFRTGEGHVISIPNGDLANRPIINISRRRNLCRTLVLPLPPDLSPQRMEQAIDMVQDVLADHEGMLPSMPPKVLFAEITPTALNLQAQYWFHPPDGGRFAALNQRVNLEILRRLQAAGISLASTLPASASGTQNRAA